MSLATLALILSAAGILATGWLAAIFVANPTSAMAKVEHLPEALPRVMTDRYIANLFLAIGATLYGDLKVIAFLFAVFAFMSFADVAIYVKRGTPYRPHLLGGIGSAITAAVAFAAFLAQLNGAA